MLYFGALLLLKRCFCGNYCLAPFVLVLFTVAMLVLLAMDQTSNTQQQ